MRRGQSQEPLLTSACHRHNQVYSKSHFSHYIPRRKSGIYWIQVRRAAAVEISLWTR